MFLSNENGYYLDISMYKEDTDPVTSQVKFKSFGSKSGPLNGLLISTPYMTKVQFISQATHVVVCRCVQLHSNFVFILVSTKMNCIPTSAVTCHSSNTFIFDCCEGCRSSAGFISIASLFIIYCNRTCCNRKGL